MDDARGKWNEGLGDWERLTNYEIKGKTREKRIDFKVVILNHEKCANISLRECQNAI